MEAGVVIACRLLPAFANKIERLAESSESFRDLCEDLAAADVALTRLTKLPEAAADQRLGEYEGWIVSLTAEIKEAVYRAEDTI
jgi:hypothetical protein